MQNRRFYVPILQYFLYNFSKPYSRRKEKVSNFKNLKDIFVYF